MTERHHGYIGYYLEIRLFHKNSRNIGTLGLSSRFNTLPSDVLEYLSMQLDTEVDSLRRTFSVDSDLDAVDTSVFYLLNRLSQDGWILRAVENESWHDEYESFSRRCWYFQRCSTRERNTTD